MSVFTFHHAVTLQTHHTAFNPFYKLTLADMIILKNQVLQCNSQKRGYKIRNFILRAYTEIHLEGGFFLPPPLGAPGGGTK